MRLWWQESPFIKDTWRLFDADEVKPKALAQVGTHPLWDLTPYPWRLHMFVPERTLDEFATLEEAKAWAEEAVSSGGML